MSLDDLALNWFDLVLIVVLVLGIHRGRQRGMSEELLSMVMWLAIVIGCAMAYQTTANAVVGFFSLISVLFAYVTAYFLVALVVAGVFVLIKRHLGGKLLGSDAFGKGEYYLGMVAGMVRFGCIIVAVLAVLNARYFNPTEVRAMANYQKDVYGSEFFPTLHTMQQEVFHRSMSGPWIRQNLGFLLIKPTAPEDKRIQRQEYTLP
jgi:uncharacterized membrane protein required for colicin V production